MKNLDLEDPAETLFHLLSEELRALRQAERLIRELLSFRREGTGASATAEQVRELEEGSRNALESYRSIRADLSEQLEFDNGIRHFVSTCQRSDLQVLFQNVMSARSTVRGLSRVMNFHSRAHQDILEAVVRAATGTQPHPQYGPTGHLATSTSHTILELRS
ncbi:hypothetical protein KOR42_45440 [Thalassoglobus neptunius]|uniref:Uncharacterized protein n=1 Tax=Thalassoglobus neptunius TaxID=1938619 RepID=A0A5C5VWV3_9PLAN|nr:hypothetical protein [Thalassoglobus neptunius]TWT43014.1 hypothetical protein KOR42_45440 [Thalassoglobus neptunius]